MSLTDCADDDEQSTPTFRPGKFDAPSYDEIDSHADLIAYSKAYFVLTVAHYDMDIDVSHVAGWEVSTRAKRRAGVVIHPDLESLTSSIITGFGTVNWEGLREEADESRLRRQHDAFDDVKDVVVRLTWGAFESFDESEWRETIRHEAVHVEQFHQYGKGDHGFKFQTRADDVGASVNCPKFEDYKYSFVCRDCGRDMGGRYRDCKTVRFARLSEEEQEKRKENGEKYWYCTDCEGFLTLKE